MLVSCQIFGSTNYLHNYTFSSFFFKKRKLIFVLCVHVYIETRVPWHLFLYCFLLSFMLKSVHFYFLCMDVLTPCMAVHHVCA